MFILPQLKFLKDNLLCWWNYGEKKNDFHMDGIEGRVSVLGSTTVLLISEESKTLEK